MSEEFLTKQFFITVAAGKRLIAKAVISLGQIRQALENHTVVVIAGTTNSYIAEELLLQLDQLDDFTKDTFFRGITTAPGEKVEARANGYFNQDIVIEKGMWKRHVTIYDIASDLDHGDIVIKGANAVDPDRKQAGILIGNPSVGTTGPILQAVIGKRVELILPVGLEKRVFGDIFTISAILNAPSSTGLRMFPVSGTIITELEAITLLTGASAQLVAAGGVMSAQGGCWIAVTGTKDQLSSTSDLLNGILKEPPLF